MTFAFVFVAMGVTNIENASTTIGESLVTTNEIMEKTELIADNLEEVGQNSLEIRDAAVAELNNLCPANPNVGDAIGMDIMGIAEQAQSDLTMLADFIEEGLETLNENLELGRSFTASADEATEKVQFWGWQMKLLSAGLFILPAFLAVGVGLVMLDLDIKAYQNAMTYFVMPLFVLAIIACYIICCAILPVSASSADACSGGGEVYGGPDDTVLTVWRNLQGDDTGLVYRFVGYYTQQCKKEYYPFDFLSSYLNELDNAVESTNDAISAVQDNQEQLEEECGRNFDNVLQIVKDMNDNLKSLQRQADLSLDLIKCENINQLYVNTVHEAGCTYSVDALIWTFASSLVISVCGLIMIMLRASYYPTEYLDLSDAWVKQVPTKSASKDSDDTHPLAASPPQDTKLALPTPERQPKNIADRKEDRKELSAAIASAREAGRPPVIDTDSITVSQINDDEFELGHIEDHSVMSSRWRR